MIICNYLQKREMIFNSFQFYKTFIFLHFILTRDFKGTRWPEAEDEQARKLMGLNARGGRRPIEVAGRRWLNCGTSPSLPYVFCYELSALISASFSDFFWLYDTD